MTTFDDLGDMFSSMNRLYTEQRELAAIWLIGSVMTGEGKRTPRIEAGMTIRVEGERIVDVSEDNPATHKVIACFGTLNSQFEMTLIDLKTNEPHQLKL